MKTIKAMKKMLAVILIPLLLLTGYLIIDRLAKNIVIGKKTDNDSGVTTGTGYYLQTRSKLSSNISGT
jgi:hypothetical protein